MKATLLKLFSLALLLAAHVTAAQAQYRKILIWKDSVLVDQFATDNIDSVTIEPAKIFLGDNTYMVDGHEFVDLGLPSGLLWATANVGADDELEAGKYYAWAVSYPDPPYREDHYKHYREFIFSYATDKYNWWDQRTVVEPADDAATVNWGADCRMPKIEEFEELADSSNCTWTWCSIACSGDADSVNGDTVFVNGYRVQSKNNGKWIFLPASGSLIDDDPNLQNQYGMYWSSTLGPHDEEYSNRPYAYAFVFSESMAERNNNLRFYGFTIRPVAE